LRSNLLGVVAFGSWARNQMVEGSDVDLLMVVRSEVQIRRSLYRTWDRTPSEWEGHRIEPHFVHLPAKDARVSGLWAEVAVDGVVLFDGEMVLSRRLAGIRRRLASGELVRRWSAGHPYWAEVD
jgi:predicted nucleotidyltransferase